MLREMQEESIFSQDQAKEFIGRSFKEKVNYLYNSMTMITNIQNGPAAMVTAWLDRYKMDRSGHRDINCRVLYCL